MLHNQAIYELHKVCRHNDKPSYPFSIYTASRTLYRSLFEAELAVEQMVDSKDERPYERVYYYAIYTLPLGEEITAPKSAAIDVSIYLPDGSLWMRQGDGHCPVFNGIVYEFVSGNSVDLCIIEDDSRGNNTCGHLVLRGEYTHGWSFLSDILPRSIPVSDEYIEALRSKHERYDQVLHDELLPSRGLQCDVKMRYKEDMNDYLYIPASFSGFRYDIYFDCNAAYRKNMHPMWLYVAYPDGANTVLLPITIANDPTLMWRKYEHVTHNLLVTENLFEFIFFNLQEIMSLADHQSSADYFLWNLTKMESITNLQANED